MVLDDNPSLKTLISEYMNNAYQYARTSVADETGVFLKNFPEYCEWKIKQVLDEEFYPS